MRYNLAGDGLARGCTLLLVGLACSSNLAAAQPWRSTTVHWQGEGGNTHQDGPTARSGMSTEQQVDRAHVPQCAADSINLLNNSGMSLSPPCLIVSAGSDSTASFEQDALTNTLCNIATFDCTTNFAPSHVRHLFFKKCITSSSDVSENPMLITWNQALHLLGNSRISVLKIGGSYTTGHEFEVAWGLLRHGEPPHQIVIETSTQPADAIQRPTGLKWHLHLNMARAALPNAYLARLGYGITYTCHVALSETTRTMLIKGASTGHTRAMHPIHGHVRMQQSSLQHSSNSPFAYPAGSVAPLAAHYQCFGRPNAVREVLRRFRQYHPDLPIFMVNDGGDEALEGIAAEFQANYTYAAAFIHPQLRAAAYAEGRHVVGAVQSLVCGFVSGVTTCAEQTGRAGNTFLAGADMVITWLQRIMSSGAHADWVILLEDDVHLQRPISLLQLKHDINGDNPNTALPEELVSVIERLRGYPLDDKHYGGGGGAIFRGSFLRELSRQGRWQEHVRQLVALYTGAVPSDQILSSLVYISEGTIGSYPGFLEKWQQDYTSRMAAGDVEVVHQEKGWYRRLQQSNSLTFAGI